MPNIIELGPTDATRIFPLLEQVHALHVHHLPGLYNAAPTAATVIPWLANWLSQDNVYGYGALVGGALVGYAIVEHEILAASPLTPARNRGHLHHISVDERFRRRGIGKGLVAACKTQMKRLGADHMIATYGPFNQASAGLLARAGMNPVMIRVQGDLSEDQTTASKTVAPIE